MTMDNTQPPLSPPQSQLSQHQSVYSTSNPKTALYWRSNSTSHFRKHNTLVKHRLLQHRVSKSIDMSTYSKACCSLPPVVSKGYENKGEYVTINGLKTYVTGPESATEAILIIYDIFGFFSQTLQGADILATADPDRKYRVFMPDFFEGSPADISWYPPQTDDHKQKLGHFFETKAPPPNTLSRIPDILQEANAKYSPGQSPSFKSWAILGHCWGGKIACLSAGPNSLFKAAVQCHPAMLDAKDAENVTIPMAVLASQDEDEDTVKAFKDSLKVEKYVETWKTQIHGWMAARGDLEDPLVKKEYENGYKAVLSFLHEHMPGVTSKI